MAELKTKIVLHCELGPFEWVIWLWVIKDVTLLCKTLA
jgi:hypothetical protein